MLTHTQISQEILNLKNIGKDDLTIDGLNELTAWIDYYARLCIKETIRTLGRD